MKHLICALGVVALGALPAAASTQYDFGTASTISLSDETTSYSADGINGTWTEAFSGGTGTTQQIDCVVPYAGTSDVCGTSGTHLGSAGGVSLPSAPGGTTPAGSNYLMVDGSPQYGAPVWLDMTGLQSGDTYSISFYQASSEETTNDVAYNDNWQVYVIPGSTGTFLCPQSYCSTYATDTGATDSGDLAYTSTVMVNGGAVTTNWDSTPESFTFTASASSEVLEFVANVVLGSNGQPPAGNSFEPPLLDLADVTLTQQTTTPEPSTWALTGLGLGLVLLTSRLRRRSPPRA
jgi:hypothetical protein